MCVLREERGSHKVPYSLETESAWIEDPVSFWLRACSPFCCYSGSFRLNRHATIETICFQRSLDVPMQIPILYEDNHLLVIEKPVNVPVQEDRSGDEDVLTLLKNDLKIRYNKPGNVYLGLIHRLDRPVGGAMVFAKTSKAASRLSDALRRQAIKRVYLAIVRGKPKRPKGKLVHYLIKNSRENKVYAVPATRKGAKQAVLSYETLESTGGFSLIAVQLHTGRPHQIRVQFSEIGCPLYGDQKYGTGYNKAGQQIALWAHTLEFQHPVTKTEVEVESCPPGRFPWSLWNGAFGKEPACQQT